MVFSKLFDEAQKKRKEPKSPPKADVRKSNEEKPFSSGKRKRKRGKKDQPEDGVKQPQQKKKGPPSAEVLEFSRQLKDLSRQKKLDEAVSLYWSPQYDQIRDEHHACIVVDCCARCGDVTAAENIVKRLQQQQHGGTINIETQTALLKAYVHAGKMMEAIQLFRTMTNPNIRTLNTLLRGCLWTAAAPISAADTEIAGGVVTSEEAWKLYQDTFSSTAVQALDTSSYEYSITLLCQALRVTEAEARIETFLSVHNIRVKGKANVTGTDQMALETLAVVYLALSRAYALLNQKRQPDCLWRTCQRCLSAIKASRALLLDNNNSKNIETTGNTAKSVSSNAARKPISSGVGASGGKRGWKSTATSEQPTRAFSNAAFRTHRLSELETEVKSLLKSRDATPLSRLDMALRIRNRLLYFSGGGTRGHDDVNFSSKSETKQSKNAHLISSWHSFGLSQFTLDKSGSSEQDSSTAIAPSEINRRCGLAESPVVRDDGTINFDLVFQDSKLPLDIEIGAGFGSWIVQQAQENIQQRNYVAVELRADRGFQIFARATLERTKPLDNVCVVGSECGSFLRDRISKSSVSTIFANHPEPPTQTYGEDQNVLQQIAKGDGKEPAHMLNSKTIVAMGRCLKQHGKIVIVSDNRSYARLIAATFAKVVRENKNLIRSIKPNELKDSTLRHLESFSNVVDLYSQNSAENNGTSYFDRLWRTGAGSHSEKRTRFMILMQRR
jgi:pentatricopeptide repeat protein